VAEQWHCRSRTHDFEWEGELVAVWEVAHDPITDDFTTETPAREILRRWHRVIDDRFPDGVVPIYWFVESPGHAKFERLPFAAEDDGENFLTFYDWPTSVETGERLNWNTIPVADKLWRPGRANKGGFLQEATGWKPAIYQPHVYVPAILAAAGLSG